MAATVPAASAPRLSGVGIDQPGPWRTALAALPSVPPSADWDYCAALCRDARLLILPNAAVVVRARCWQGTIDWCSPYGWAGWIGSTAPDARNAYNEAAREAGAICSFLVGCGAPPPEAQAYRTIYRAHLPQLLEAGVRVLPKGSASALKAWWRSAPEVVEGADALAAPLENLYAQTMQRVGAGGAYRHAPGALQSLSASHLAWVGGVREHGEVVAVTLLLAYGTQAEYFAFASQPDARRHARGLLWLGYERLAARGVESINLGGGLHEGDGLAQFKHAMGGQPQPSWRLRAVHDARRYEMLSAGLPSTQYFPPWHAVQAQAS